MNAVDVNKLRGIDAVEKEPERFRWNSQLDKEYSEKAIAATEREKRQ